MRGRVLATIISKKSEKENEVSNVKQLILVVVEEKRSMRFSISSFLKASTSWNNEKMVNNIVSHMFHRFGAISVIDLEPFIS